jgi:hypothetical protein
LPSFDSAVLHIFCSSFESHPHFLDLLPSLLGSVVERTIYSAIQLFPNAPHLLLSGRTCDIISFIKRTIRSTTQLLLELPSLFLSESRRNVTIRTVRRKIHMVSGRPQACLTLARWLWGFGRGFLVGIRVCQVDSGVPQFSLARRLWAIGNIMHVVFWAMLRAICPESVLSVSNCALFVDFVIGSG